MLARSVGTATFGDAVAMLITTDLHLTDRERDEYRWELFPWLARRLFKDPDKLILILGDLTDEKDGHGSALVNRIVDALHSLPGRVMVLMGNHDYRDRKTPFFRFLGRSGGDVHFVHEPTEFVHRRMSMLLLPHTRTPVEDWDRLEPPRGLDAIFCHQTFNGAAAANGSELASPLPANYWRDRGITCPVLSGDIHTPQELGQVTYVGTPYPVAFGDAHEPRVASTRMEGRKLHVSWLPVPSIRKAVLEIAGPEGLAGLQAGDQAKVRLRLARAEFAEFDARKSAILAQAKKQGVHVHAVELLEATGDELQQAAAARTAPGLTAEPSKLLKAFCRARQVPPAEREAGAAILSRLT